MTIAETAPASDRELVLTRIIDAPREKLFRAWTDAELLKQWFAPLPYTTPVAELDVRPGGANLVVMRSPDGKDLPNRGVYLEVVENERLVFTDAYTKAWEPSQKPFMTVILTFEDEGGGKTRYTARAPLDGCGPRGAREDGLPRRLGPVHRSARCTGGQDLRHARHASPISGFQSIRADETTALEGGVTERWQRIYQRLHAAFRARLFAKGKTTDLKWLLQAIPVPDDR
jgi:uncharacterized protein YndB with AHSA1/START domain